MPLSKILRPSLDTGVPNVGFAAKKNSDVQTLSSATLTKVTFDTELFDTNNNFASSRFTPTIAGQYFFYADFIFFSINSGISSFSTASSFLPLGW